MSEKIISINNELKAKTMDEKREEVLNKLVNSQEHANPITGVVSGVEVVGDMPVAVIYLGLFKIIIPAVEFMDFTVDDGKDPVRLLKYLLRKRLGSEIEYIVKGIDESKSMAVASRKDAMDLKKKEFLLSKDDDGNYLVEKDDIVEVRVVSVLKDGIIVECFGVETYIPPKDLSYRRVYNSGQLFSVSDRVLIKITSIIRGEDGEVKLQGSVKAAYDNPVGEIMKRFNIGDTYIGKVTMIDNNGVFVALDGGMDVLCKYPDFGFKPIIGSTVSVRVTLKNEELNRMFGIITNVARL